MNYINKNKIIVLSAFACALFVYSCSFLAGFLPTLFYKNHSDGFIAVVDTVVTIMAFSIIKIYSKNKSLEFFCGISMIFWILTSVNIYLNYFSFLDWLLSITDIFGVMILGYVAASFFFQYWLKE